MPTNGPITITITLSDEETAIIVIAITYLHLTLHPQNTDAILARTVIQRIIDERTLQSRPPN